MKLLYLLAVLLMGVVCGAAVSRCPPKNKVQNSTPKCHDDYDCLKNNKICCPNAYNDKSCTYPGPYNSGHDRYKSTDKYKPYNTGYKSLGKRGLFENSPWQHCDGVKCMPYQVCKEDCRSGKKKCQLP